MRKFFPCRWYAPDRVAFLTKLFSSLLPSSSASSPAAPSLSTGDRAKAEARLSAPAAVLSAARLVDLLDSGKGYFAGECERVLEEVRRRCKDAEVWQSFYLDLLDEDGEGREEGEGVGAEPVDPDEELRRLLAGVRLFPQIRPRYAWELGYHVLRYALSTRDEPLVRTVASAAAEDFLLAYDGAKDVEAKVNAVGDLAGALLLAGDPVLAGLLCDFAAISIDAQESARQELHRLRTEGAAFVRECYGEKRSG